MTVVDDGVDEDEHRTEILFMFSAAEIYYNYRNIAFVVDARRSSVSQPKILGDFL